MYRCIIVDDEQHAIDGLSDYLEQLPHFKVVNTFTDSIVAFKEILNSEIVDVIFLDINMPKMNGIELIKKIRNKASKIIFTTAHQQYAYNAYEELADAYLLKPYSLTRFTTTLDKFFPQKEILTSKKEDFFFVKSKLDNNNIVRINFQEVICVESKLNYITIYTREQAVVVYMSLKEIGDTLFESADFMQLHRSYIVNKTKIIFIAGRMIRLSNGMEINVSDSHKKDFKNFMQQRLLRGTKN